MKYYVICMIGILLSANHAKANIELSEQHQSGLTTSNKWMNIRYPSGVFNMARGGIDGDYVVGTCEAVINNGHDIARYVLIYNITTQNWTRLETGRDANMFCLETDGIPIRVKNNYVFDRFNHIYSIDTQKWITLNVSGNDYSTTIKDIDGDNVIGIYSVQTKLNGFYADFAFHSFVFNIITGKYTAFDIPGGQEEIDKPNKIIGDNIFVCKGQTKHAFLYNINKNSWTKIDKTGENKTYSYDMNGDYIIGTYDTPYGQDQYHQHAFLYNIINRTWTDIEKQGISGKIEPIMVVRNNLLCYDDSNFKLFSYNIGNQKWSDINVPGWESTSILKPMYVENNILFHDDARGSCYLYNVDTQKLTNIDIPGAKKIFVSGISGNRMIGTYISNTQNIATPFIYIFTSGR